MQDFCYQCTKSNTSPIVDKYSKNTIQTTEHDIEIIKQIISTDSF